MIPKVCPDCGNPHVRFHIKTSVVDDGSEKVWCDVCGYNTYMVLPATFKLWSMPSAQRLTVYGNK